MQPGSFRTRASRTALRGPFDNSSVAGDSIFVVANGHDKSIPPSPRGRMEGRALLRDGARIFAIVKYDDIRSSFFFSRMASLADCCISFEGPPGPIREGDKGFHKGRIVLHDRRAEGSPADYWI